MRITEILIALSIILLVGTMLTVSFGPFREREGLAGAVDASLEALGRARSDTLASRNGARYGVRFASTSATVFPGNSYAEGVAQGVLFPYGDGAELSQVSFPGGGADIFFERVTGKASFPGSLVFVSRTDPELTKTVRITGSGSAYVE